MRGQTGFYTDSDIEVFFILFERCYTTVVVDSKN